MSTPDDAPAESEGSRWPFLAALAVFATVLIVIAVLAFTGGDGLTEEERVGRAAVGQNDALQRMNWSDYLSFTCPEIAGAEAEVFARQRDSTAKDGARFIDDVTDVVIEGDRARANVQYHFDKAADAKRTAALQFARRDEAWKVCSAYQ